MNIADLQFGYGTEVPDKISLNIYFSGCYDNKLCDRILCHNPELHNFKYGKPVSEFFNKIKRAIDSEIVECICFLGGEPFDQDLLQLLNFIFQLNIDKPIYAYTGYTKEQILELKKDYLLCIDFTNICYGEFKEGNNKKEWLYK